MENNLQVYESKPLTAAEVRAQVNLIQEVMKAVMKEGTHFGKVPGCGDKNTLLKPGAEKIMATFKLAADPTPEDLSTPDCVKYRMKVRILTFGGQFVGAGVGECSTDEEKYKWRKAVCKQEFDATPENQRRVKWDKYGKSFDQVRTQPADLANTVLKMAKKRALVDAVLTATAASDIFTQDIEDLPEELLDKADVPQGKPTVSTPQPKAQPTPQPAPATAPEQSAADFANEIAGEFQCVTEPEYLTVEQALQAKEGDTIGVRAVVTKTFDKKVGSKGSDRASYCVGEGSNTAYINMWGIADKNLEGQECFFTGVKVSMWQSKPQFMAEMVSPCN